MVLHVVAVERRVAELRGALKDRGEIAPEGRADVLAAEGLLHRDRAGAVVGFGVREGAAQPLLARVDAGEGLG